MPAYPHITFKTAFGHAGLAYRRQPFALMEICLPRATADTLDEQIADSGWGPQRACPAAVEAAALIKSYFDGALLDVPWHWLEMTRFSPAQADVYRCVAAIPRGQVRSYGQIAAEVGRSGAARFVGNCMARNPYPVIIPCHRVVRGDGSLGGFGGGLALKARMLALEGLKIDPE